MKILVPTDFSDGAREAFDYAVNLYSDYDTIQYVLLHSYEMPRGGSAGGVMMNLEEAMKKESVRDLSIELKYMREKYPDLEIETRSRYGSVENAVARTVNEDSVGLVVMGTHGASGFKKAMIGSNTAKVLDNIVKPVISVPCGWKYKRVKDIVYATDLHRMENPEALLPIQTVSKHFDATIHIVYVAENPGDIDLEKEVEKLPLNKMFKDRKKTFKVIESRNVADGINDYVKEINADMAVLIPKVATFWQKLFKNSVTEGVAFHASVPLLAIKDA